MDSWSCNPARSFPACPQGAALGAHTTRSQLCFPTLKVLADVLQPVAAVRSGGSRAPRLQALFPPSLHSPAERRSPEAVPHLP